MIPGARARLGGIFARAVAAVEAGAAVQRAFVSQGGELAIAGRVVPRTARLVVLAAGKAAAPMAAAVEAVAGDRVAAGLVVTKDGHGGPLARCALREAGHPVPDARSETAARAALALVRGTGAGDVLLVLLSGGASALLACPQPGLSLDDVAGTTARLLASGADIRSLNTVRKHLVEVAGGRLACAAGAGRIEVLVVSDVSGDPLDVIASGPCAPDPSTYAEAEAVLTRHGLASEVPAAVRAHLRAGVRGERPESPKPGDPRLARVRSTVVASLGKALAAAADAAREAGSMPVVATAALRGEARTVGRRLAALAGAIRTDGTVCLMAGGETTVTVRGRGRGGRCQELALAAAAALADHAGWALLAAGTDGTDGPTDAAGAFADGGTVGRGAARGIDAASALARNDAYHFFAAEGGLLHTGPSGTNVTDLVLLEVAPGGLRRSAPIPFPNPSKSV